MHYRQQVHVRCTFYVLKSSGPSVTFKAYIDFLGVSERHFPASCNAPMHGCCALLALSHLLIGKNAFGLFPVQKKGDLKPAPLYRLLGRSFSYYFLLWVTMAAELLRPRWLEISASIVADK